MFIQAAFLDSWLEVKGIKIVSRSPVLTRRVIEGRVRLIESSQAEEVGRSLEAENVTAEPALGNS
jgi:hypothetical protein